MGFPIFFDAGLVVMLPIIFAVARRLDGPLLLYGLPAAGAFSVMHVFVPPHPGPVTAIAAYGANPGLVLLTGIIVAFPMWYISGYLWGRIAGTPLSVRHGRASVRQHGSRHHRQPAAGIHRARPAADPTGADLRQYRSAFRRYAEVGERRCRLVPCAAPGRPDAGRPADLGAGRLLRAGLAPR